MLQSSAHMCRKKQTNTDFSESQHFKNNGKHVLARELWNTDTSECMMNTLSSSITSSSTEHKDCSDMVEPAKWWIFNSSEEQHSIISAESLAALNLNLLNQITRSPVFFKNEFSWTWPEFKLSHLWRSRLAPNLNSSRWWRYNAELFFLKTNSCCIQQSCL